VVADIVDSTTRSRMMSGIRGKNTKPEIAVRKGLFARGFRFRLHRKDLPGKPDIVLPKFSAVVLVNGCFWHGHDCHLFKQPGTRPEFWKRKFATNRENDKRAKRRLRQEGWRVLVIWECALKGKTRKPLDAVLDEAAEWIRGDASTLTIRGERRARQ